MWSNTSRIVRCFASFENLFDMINIFLPESNGSGIKPGTVQIRRRP
ncbi:hypothetical protein FHX49_000532 [Microbacterium endophyticum]|uniref:Uncharacterized protein n=1 Tax=Microbacterium endophyticum TaxID=1526412 RepID=A0A7W4V194_9MICO|nr:hypothetical protein [Microbacterium endophyticum]NIK37288.1 hypothetical protein [Microbacterium endophyticum]